MLMVSLVSNYIGQKSHPHQGRCQVSTVSAINTQKADIINVAQIPVFSLGKKPSQLTIYLILEVIFSKDLFDYKIFTEYLEMEWTLKII